MGPLLLESLLRLRAPEYILAMLGCTGEVLFEFVGESELLELLPDGSGVIARSVRIWGGTADLGVGGALPASDLSPDTDMDMSRESCVPASLGANAGPPSAIGDSPAARAFSACGVGAGVARVGTSVFDMTVCVVANVIVATEARPPMEE